MEKFQSIDFQALSQAPLNDMARSALWRQRKYQTFLEKRQSTPLTGRENQGLKSLKFTPGDTDGGEQSAFTIQNISSLYRQGQQLSRQANSSGLKKAALKVAAPLFQQATSKLLQETWEALFTPAFPLAWLYIHIHIFLRFTIGEEYFCKLGHEWSPKGSGKAGSAAKEAEEGGSGVASSVFGIPFSAWGLLEGAGLALLDLVAIFSVLMSLTFSGMIIYAVVNPVDTVAAIFKTLGMSEMFDLIISVFK